MYPCSDAFHRACAENQPQMALLVFADGVITNEDISIDEGIEFNDYFCTKEDLSIGEAISNEISFRLMNEKQLLNDFPFGDFRALLGVRLSIGENTEGFTMTYGGHVYTTMTAAGRHLLKDGEATAGQPPFLVSCLMAMDDVIYAFGLDGQPYAVSAKTGKAVACPDTAFMREKTARLSGITFAYEDRILTVRIAGETEETYEFVPLGTFTAEKPNVADDVEISLTCHDIMMKLDEDMEGLEIQYPITLKDLLKKVCESEGVPVKNQNFLNYNVTVASQPDELKDCKKRDVVGWIAEAAGANAKINRDGQMELVWLRETEQRYDEGTYSECRPYYYRTRKVNRLCVRDIKDVTESMIGSGKNTYLIQDNPFLR
jgi:hypothetical protein